MGGASDGWGSDPRDGSAHRWPLSRDRILHVFFHGAFVGLRIRLAMMNTFLTSYTVSSAWQIGCRVLKGSS